MLMGRPHGDVVYAELPLATSWLYIMQPPAARFGQGQEAPGLSLLRSQFSGYLFILRAFA